MEEETCVYGIAGMTTIIWNVGMADEYKLMYKRVLVYEATIEGSIMLV
jgi:hypothetical protein